ncbi:hypothetical protein J4Q44_G00111260 [Coregonus suidteri]|uniref:Uncharacterized protein n=1 Tax=Coregonus suidteri TaxID=861788 RepID=A0AAN8LTC8_9TELE
MDIPTNPEHLRRSSRQPLSCVWRAIYPPSTIDYVCSFAKKHAVPVWYEPTDCDKACKPFLSDSWKALAYTSPTWLS